MIHKQILKMKMKKKGKLYKFHWNKPKYIKFKILKEN